MHEGSFRLLDVLATRFVLDSKGIQRIKAIKGTLIPICVTGPTLSGKSSLLNSIIGKPVFPVGNTTRSTTKGVNCYLQQFKNTKENIWIAFLDVQGFDDLENQSSQQIDRKLLMLLMSISHTLIYNSFGALETKTISRIDSILQEVPQSSCEIIFVQRDFSLRMINQDGETISPSEYLQKCIKSYLQKTKSNNPKTLTQKTSCFLLPPPSSQSHKKKHTQLSTHLHTSTLLSLFSPSPSSPSSSPSSPCPSLPHFLSTLQICTQLLSSNKCLEGMFLRVGEKLRQERKLFETLFKMKFSQFVKKGILGNLPMPQELVKFKIQQAKVQALESVGNQVRCIENTYEQFVSLYAQRNGQKILAQNQEKIKGFLRGRVKEEGPGGEEGFEELKQYCSFVTEKYRDYFLAQYYKGLYEKAVKGLGDNEMKIQKEKLDVENLQQELKSKNQQLEQKQMEISQLREQMRSYENESKQMKIVLAAMEQTSKDRENQLLQKLKKQFSQISPQIPNPQFPQNPPSSALQQKLCQLEQTNQTLRSQLHHYVVSGNCADEILKKYNESVDKIQQKQMQIKNLCVEKDNIISSLRKELKMLEDVNRSLQEQSALLRDTTNDRTKVSKMFQKLLASKEEMLQSKQAQLMQCLTQHKEEVSKIQIESGEKIRALEKELTYFIMKNEQLVKKNDQLSQQLEQKSSKVKKQLLEKLQTSQNENQKLQNQLQTLQKTLEETTITSNTLSQTSSNLLTQHSETISSLTCTLSQTKSHLSQVLVQKESLMSTISQLENCIELLKMKNQEVTSNLQKEISLRENKIAHLQDSLKKLKKDMKQKQDTFQMTLLQLRSNNVISMNTATKSINHSSNTNGNNIHFNESNAYINTTINGINGINGLGVDRKRTPSQTKQKYLRRIDYIEELALKQLDQISNYSGVPAQLPKQRLSLGPCLSRGFDEGENFRYGTDRKERKDKKNIGDFFTYGTTTEMQKQKKHFCSMNSVGKNLVKRL